MMPTKPHPCAASLTANLTAGLTAGFMDPVQDAQYNFRQCLTAFAEPGTIRQLRPPPELPDTALPPASLAFILTLADLDTPLWSAPDPALQAYCRFHTGAGFVAPAEQAAFALLTGAEAALPFGQWAFGTDECPHHAATLIIAVDDLAPDGPVRFSGPGIKDSRRIGIEAVPPHFWRARAALAPFFPRGLDLLFAAGDRIAACPRTTIVTED